MNISPRFSNGVNELKNNGLGVTKDASFKPELPSDSVLPLLVIIDNRALDRECLAHGLTNHSIEMSIATFSSFEQWQHQRRGRTAGAVLFNIGGQKVSDPAVGNYLHRIVTDCAPAPVILLADKEEISQVLKALDHGVKGYIPTSVNVNVCVEALRLAMAGGTFVPASSVLALRHATDPNSQRLQPLGGMFTQRQAEVVNALRRGKANKIIAYELKLRESTVKVHIRNIMKKLKASNRTEVACIINELFPSETSFSDLQ
ncbi:MULTISPECIES: response regulator transcription factor [Brucella/Ochrobactrum group]|jgi:DNA-binding NarL/FixJ family response regulator|uniref:Response regulator transcription factor n=1 Tax=Brucella pseudintermedia TaxID=370111 RepID=A0ABY5UKU9_9HYPH|nr:MULTISPECIES: response regulator transcription factor [Brucella/Ochrobactrum group]KAB2681245.1 response regulator transcription factor [Brucella pseudintermedia]MCO7727975.1 response regulator transcription factor [Brucella intermedia]NKE75178.1 response regulator transcription factor [Ochrobactrum sp. MC-1LL]TWH04450.1 DNA-binding NarL/FixJ family response regulator [Ochrobactrum sp. J50]UWL62639.1 response regulator transcription factor [Brucella pseudintermedia]